MGLFKSSIAPYLYMGLFLALGAGAFGLWKLGDTHGEKDGKAAVAEQIEERYRDELSAAKAEARLAKELNLELVGRLAQVPTAQAVKEAVSENPSNCPTAAPVRDSLRKQASDANASRTSGKRNGSVPPAR